MAHVAIFGKYYPPFSGGIETNTQDVAKCLSKEHEVAIYCFNHRSGYLEEAVDKVQIRRFPAAVIWKGQPLGARFLLTCFTAKADLYHLHAPNFIVSTAFWLRTCFGLDGQRIVITHHTDVFGRKLLRSIVLPFYRSLTRRVAKVIVTSMKNAQGSLDLPPEAPIIAIPLCIDPSQFPFRHSDRTIDEDHFTVGFMGRHARYKGLPDLLQALQMMPGVKAIIGGDGPYRTEAERMSCELGLESRVKFIGDVRGLENKRAFFQSIDVFAFPSTEITETFGITQLEAMASGVPVVASDLPTGVTDVAVHEETALLVPPSRPEKLAAALKRLAADKPLRTRLTQQARSSVDAQFSQSVVNEQVRALFDGLLDSLKSRTN